MIEIQEIVPLHIFLSYFSGHPRLIPNKVVLLYVIQNLLATVMLPKVKKKYKNNQQPRGRYQSIRDIGFKTKD